MHPETFEDLVFYEKGIANTQLLEEAILEEAAKMIYGKKSTVLKVRDKRLFENFDNQEKTFFSRLWKRIS
jgi:hypothetical protein